MRFEVLRSRSSCVNIALALLFFAQAGSSIAKPNEKAAESPAVEASSKPVCTLPKDARQKARRLVERTNQFKTVQREAKQATPVGYVAYLDDIDQPELWKGKCHQGVTVYVDRLNRFDRRLSFLVDLRTGKLFLEDVINGEYEALRKLPSGQSKPAAHPAGS